MKFLPEDFEQIIWDACYEDDASSASIKCADLVNGRLETKKEPAVATAEELAVKYTLARLLVKPYPTPSDLKDAYLEGFAAGKEQGK